MEIAYNGRWGMVCDENFSSTDAQTVCEGLGFNRDDASVMSLTSARYMRLIIQFSFAKCWFYNHVCV